MNISYAGLGVRSVAFALDYLVIAAYLVLLAAVSVVLNNTYPALPATLFANQLSAHITAFLLVTLPVSLYFALRESSSWQATWGKRVVGLRVIRTDGARLSVGRAVARTLLTFIPWELAHTLIWQIRFAPATSSALIIGGFVLVWVLVGANIASLALRQNHQSLADWLAGTYVIRSRLPEHPIRRLDEEEKTTEKASGRQPIATSVSRKVGWRCARGRLAHPSSATTVLYQS